MARAHRHGPGHRASRSRFFEQVQPIHNTYYGESKGFVPSPAPDHATNRLLPDLEASPLYAETFLFRHRWDQTYETPDYADLLRSYSTSHVLTEDDREALITEISQCVDHEFGGRVTRPLVITLTLARTRREDSLGGGVARNEPGILGIDHRFGGRVGIRRHDVEHAAGPHLCEEAVRLCGEGAFVVDPGPGVHLAALVAHEPGPQAERDQQRGGLPGSAPSAAPSWPACWQ
jgi:hypothetical protein